MFTEAEHQTQNTVMDKEMKKQSEYILHDNKSTNKIQYSWNNQNEIRTQTNNKHATTQKKCKQKANKTKKHEIQTAK